MNDPRFAKSTVVRILKATGASVGGFLIAGLMVEGMLQVVAAIRPSYEVLFLQPDKELGWKQVPNLRWTWAGHYWYASDFNVDVETNSLGFRDYDRRFRKPPFVKRVALFGDSFIEAVQVPLEGTAGQLLEQGLNTRFSQARGQEWNWEVLNFGISNFGVGQYLLGWEQYGKYFQPDYVAILVAELQLRRTVSKYEDGGFPATKDTRLWVRPWFRLKADHLIREPARDFERFVELQDELIAVEFGGQRSRRRRNPPILFYYLRETWHRMVSLRHSLQSDSNEIGARSDSDVEEQSKLLSVNAKIMEVLGREIASTGGILVLLDASQYFGDSPTVSRALRDLSSNNGFGYIPVYLDLLKANADGISTRWAHDGHLNEDGNQIVADALYGWISQHHSVSGATE